MTSIKAVAVDRRSRPADVRNPEDKSLIRSLGPIMVVVLVAYLIIGLAMPVLPLYVSHQLGLSTFMVGVAAGVEFASALLSRFAAGTYADRRGARRAMVAGLIMGVIAGAFYVASIQFIAAPAAAIALLLIGRVFLGGAESYIITGGLSAGLTIGGAGNAGRVISWIGTALWAAYAAGAPLGSWLYSSYGFKSIALATGLLPLAALALVTRVRRLPVLVKESPSITTVVRAVSLPGIGMGLTAIGFGAISTFAALMFAERGWPSGWLALTALSAAFILGRILFGTLPDRKGGANVALIFVVIEALGIAAVWLAPTPMFVFIGAAIAGFGYSLVYPGFGVEAVRLAPEDSRGLAMGAFSAFLDLALGVSTPALGLLAGFAGLRSVFLVSAIVVALAAIVAIRLKRVVPSASEGLLSRAG